MADYKEIDKDIFERLHTDEPVEADEYREYVVRKINEGLADAQSGRLIPQGKVEKYMKKWIGDDEND